MGRAKGTDGDKDLDLVENPCSPLTLRSISSTVAPDGAYADFHVKYEGVQPIQVRVSFGEFPKLWNEVRAASAAMMHRRLNRVDRGRRQIAEMIDSALTPVDISVLIDRKTLDRILVLHMPDGQPLPLRVSARGIDRMFNDIADALVIARSRSH